MTIEERDERIKAVMESDAFLPIKAQRIREIHEEYDADKDRERARFEAFDSVQSNV